MANKRPSALPAGSSFPNTAAIMADDGVAVTKWTPVNIVDSGRPLANQSEAETGTDADKAMTPLTTKQSIASEIGVSVASKAQGDLADSAVQPGDLATVATSGDYDDLTNKPTLGTAAAEDIEDFATAAQGSLADSAVQPGDLGDLALKDKVSVPADIDASGTPEAGKFLDGTGAWSVPSGAGDMLASVYDPNGVESDAFDSANHTFDPSGTDLSSTDVQAAIAEVAGRTPLPGYLFGLEASAAIDTEHDLTFQPGAAASDDSVPVMMNLSSAITKQFDATFSAGTNAGAMVSGDSIPSGGQVHVFLIMKADGTTDICGATTLSPTLPTDFIYKRRLMTFRTNGSANIRTFIQSGDYFEFIDAPNVVSANDQGDSSVQRTLAVPSGFRVLARGWFSATNTNVAAHVLGRGDATISTPSASNGYATLVNNGSAYAATEFTVLTDTSGQVATRSNAASSSIRIQLIGWTDIARRQGL